MRPAHFIPPAAALLGSGILLAMQNQETVALREEITHMRGALQKAALLPSPPSEASEKAGAGKAETAGEKPAGPEGGKITVKDLALLADRSSSAGVPDIRAMLRLQSAIAAMPPEEVAALLREVESSEFPERQKGSIKMLLLSSVSQKDPKAAVMIAAELDKGASGPADQSRWVLSSSFEMWAAKDPAAATAWYDARVAAGEYENKALSIEFNEKRVDFERGLFRALFGKDQAAARARLDALTPQERRMVMDGGDLPTDVATRKSFAAFARELLDEKDRASVIGTYGARIAGKGELEDVSSFLDSVEATPEERREAVERAVSGKFFADGEKITEENSAEWRAWLTKTAPPDKVAETLGNTLAQMANMNRITAEQFADLVPKISPEGGRDRVVASFIEKSYWRGNQEAVVNLARTLEDKELRSATMERLKERGMKVESEPAPVK